MLVIEQQEYEQLNREKQARKIQQQYERVIQQQKEQRYIACQKTDDEQEQIKAQKRRILRK